MNAVKVKETKKRFDSVIEDATKQAIMSAIAMSIYTLDQMELSEEQIMLFYRNIIGMYALPDDIFGKQANDYDVMKIISEKFPEVDFQKMYPLLKVKIE